MKQAVRIASIVMVLLVCMLTDLPAARAGKNYVLATASPGGTYYPVGTAIATLVKAGLSLEHDIGMVAIPTAGSVENLRLLERGEADFAIMQGLVAHDAWSGKRTFANDAPHRGFRAVTALWRNVEQFVLRTEHVRTGTIADLLALKGGAVGLGDRESGTLLSNRVLLENLGVDIDRYFLLSYLGYGPAADALQAGNILAIGIPAGLPTKSLSRMKAAMGSAATILGFTAEQAMLADNGLGLWSRYVIAAQTYPDQPESVTTIAQPNLLVVNAGVSDDAVYRVVKVLFERRAFLQAMHPATAELELQNALVGLPVPLHPGAQRYFEEAGLTVPVRLRAP
jgi:TRAP transporter TAXI family solute receptor